MNDLHELVRIVAYFAEDVHPNDVEVPGPEDYSLSSTTVLGWLDDLTAYLDTHGSDLGDVRQLLAREAEKNRAGRARSNLGPASS